MEFGGGDFSNIRQMVTYLPIITHRQGQILSNSSGKITFDVHKCIFIDFVIFVHIKFKCRDH